MTNLQPYLRPTSIEPALEALAEGKRTIIAGATDLFPSRGNLSTTIEPILDITAISELSGIQPEGNGWRIGALTTWADIGRSSLPPVFSGLCQAATQIGGIQIQNVATVVGNVCNASPAADGVPPLLTLDASIELRSTETTRVLPLNSFILGNRSTARRPDELVTALLIPKYSTTRESPSRDITPVGGFVKLGARAYLVISIVMVAAVAEIDSDGVIQAAKIAVGACSAVPKRLTQLEVDLVGTSLGKGHDALSRQITADHLKVLSPIDDVRASASYRLSVTPHMISQALLACHSE